MNIIKKINNKFGKETRTGLINNIVGFVININYIELKKLDLDKKIKEYEEVRETRHGSTSRILLHYLKNHIYIDFMTTYSYPNNHTIINIVDNDTGHTFDYVNNKVIAKGVFVVANTNIEDIYDYIFTLLKNSKKIKKRGYNLKQKNKTITVSEYVRINYEYRI